MTYPRDAASTAMLGVTLEDGRQLSEVEAGWLVDAAMGVAGAEIVRLRAKAGKLLYWVKSTEARQAKATMVAAGYLAAELALANNGERHD